ncbi:hypothetical protein CRM22_005437 [Opisthorchis felineus]|uniref:Cytochrome b5 heme-binding domain-containing protein n=1 Tax=Opisthorchis felineus TaxID=147828 RepID=A0A4S2LY67_OPIFE|nr:hypothetical protein CRM22_005437 [Opisthorchis felineus]
MSVQRWQNHAHVGCHTVCVVPIGWIPTDLCIADDTPAFVGPDHPGGSTVLEEQSGGYATEPFEDVGHSEDAREMMQQYYIGDIAVKDKENRLKFTSPFTMKSKNASIWTGLLIPISVILVAAITYKFLY